MTVNPDTPFELTASQTSPRQFSPLRIVVFLAVMIYLAEIISMGGIYFLSIPSYLLISLLDGFLMICLILPGLYFLQLKPLQQQMEERNRAEAALRANEKLLVKVMELLPVGVWLIDKEGKVVHGNPASQEIWAGARYVGIQEYSEYKGWWADTGKRIEAEEWAAARVLAHSETILNEEVNIEAFDGTPKTILNSAVPILDEDDTIVGAVVVNQDISSLKMTQKALEDREALLRTVMENLPVGVWLADEKGNITYGNPAGLEIWKGARYVGIEKFGEYKGWWLSTGKCIEPDEWGIARAINKGEMSLNEEIEIECFDGSHRIILNSAIPVSDENGQILWAFVVNQDITERKQRERALVKTNELLEKFFLSISTLIAYMDRDFNFIRVNDAYARAAGHLPDILIGQNHFDLYPHDENQSIFQQVVDSGEPFSALEKPFEYPEYPERGVTYWDWSLQPVKGGSGIVEGLVLSLVDVTERKRAEIQLERKNQELLALSHAERTARELAENLVKATISLNSNLELDHVIETMLEYLHKIVPMDFAGISLFEGENRMRVRAVQGYGQWSDLNQQLSFPFGAVTDSMIRQMEASRRSIRMQNSGLPLPMFGDGTRARICTWRVVPIIATDKAIGLVVLGRVGEEDFRSEMVLWAEALIGQAAVSIQNAWLFQQVRASSDRLQSLTRKLVEIQENERYHIARELHDEAGQALSWLKLSLGRLEQDPDCPQHISQRLAELKKMTDGVLEDLHRLAVDLRPIALDHLGLVAALEQYVKNLNADRFSVQFKAKGFDKERLPKDIETCLYRISQEALANVVRHARSENVGVLLARGDGKVRLFVEDDGIGFDPKLPENNRRLGLAGMRERAEMFGGTLTIESSPGEGTSIIVEVPDGDSDSDRR